MTRSLIQSTISDFEAANAPLRSPVRTLLDDLCATPDRHARFLNTLSMMEHIGSQKIMVTQSGGAIDRPTLKHLAEESRHAFFFKREAEKAAGRPLAYGAGELMAPASARMYFQRLESRVARSFGKDVPAQVVYLYMSMIIEFRAVWGYRLYQDALARAGHALSLKSLLAEEAGHLSDMAERLAALGCLSAARVTAFCDSERRLFERLVKALRRAVGEESGTAPPPRGSSAKRGWRSSA